MGRSLGFGSDARNWTPSSDSVSLRLRDSYPLTSLRTSTRRLILQKARRHHHRWLRPLAGPRFQVLFHSPPGVLFTFPSRYYALSVAAEYLALEGGPPCFRQDSSCPAVLRVAPTRACGFAYGAFTRSGRPSQGRSAHHMLSYRASFRTGAPYNPAPCRHGPVWAPPRSLAATGGISIDFYSCRYLDGSLPCVSPARTIDSCARRHRPDVGVTPFGHPRISGCWLLPVAFRS